MRGAAPCPAAPGLAVFACGKYTASAGRLMASCYAGLCPETRGAVGGLKQAFFHPSVRNFVVRG
ncbi:MAG: hypothetical protein MJY70_02210 [Bacteroidales bacterium]|nr:hypothetical protein [Bacteroidales bacterium]